MSPRPLDPDLWNVLHDGSIEAISGSVPGNVQLTVAISYLRDLFEDPGKAILITLYDCICFCFTPWDAAEPVTDLAAISALELKILSFQEADGIVCAISHVPGGGFLAVEAAGFSLALDSGRPIQLGDLLAAAKGYWGAFDIPTP